MLRELTSERSSEFAASQLIPATVSATASHRNYALDVLRGVAVLGILIVNIIGFGLPWAAYANPRAYGGDGGASLAFWFTQSVLFDGKMRGIFSMLFGASFVLMISRWSEKHSADQIADLYIRRMLWLMAIGMGHAYLFTTSDILFTYGLVGLFLFPLRNVVPSRLIVVGGLLLTVIATKALREGLDDLESRDAARELTRLESAGTALSADQVAQRDGWLRRERQLFVPDTAAIRANIARERSGYVANLKHRLRLVPHLQSRAIYDHDGFDVGGMMLIGMGLALSGVLTGRRSTRFYVGLLSAGYALGIGVSAALAWNMWSAGFRSLNTHVALRSTEDFTRLSVALGHISLIILVIQRGWLRPLSDRLAAAGRMALTNYIMSTVLCGLFFAGYGLAMFGRLRRHELLYVVVAVWLLILWWSPWWLRHFHYGPTEWVWRSLARWKKQPFARSPTAMSAVSTTAPP